MKAALISIALALSATIAAGAAPSAPTSISVGGTGTVTMLPDQATVQASVVTTADAASSAVSDNNRAYARIVDALTRAGIARDDVSLSYYNVNYVPKPPASAPPQPQERYGYTVTRNFTIKVRKMDRAGAIVDAVTSAGATNVDGVYFGLANPQRARAEATRRAVADARAKAEALASAAGLHLLGIVSMTMDTAEPVHPLVMRAMAVPAPAQAPTVLDPGNVTVTAEVSIVYSASP